MRNTGADKYEITAREIHENQFTVFLHKLEDDLWKSDSCGLDSERKKVLASSHGALACALMDLGVFGSVETHFPSEKLILPYFSSPSMVAILVCDSHRQAGSSILHWENGSPLTRKRPNGYKHMPEAQGSLPELFFVHYPGRSSHFSEGLLPICSEGS